MLYIISVDAKEVCMEHMEHFQAQHDSWSGSYADPYLTVGSLLYR